MYEVCTGAPTTPEASNAARPTIRENLNASEELLSRALDRAVSIRSFLILADEKEKAAFTDESNFIVSDMTSQTAKVAAMADRLNQVLYSIAISLGVEQ